MFHIIYVLMPQWVGLDIDMEDKAVRMTMMAWGWGRGRVWDQVKARLQGRPNRNLDHPQEVGEGM